MILAKVRLFKSSVFSEIYIRNSMTIAKRQKDFESRQQAREKNKGKHQKEWVVYKGTAVRRAGIASKQGNVCKGMGSRI